MASLEFFQSKGLNVSRETFHRLQLYHDALLKWQNIHNLVSKSTLSMIWERHFLDSAQLVSHIPSSVQVIADIGSGAGFPGMVISLITQIPVFLIESHQKKAFFLKEIQRTTEAPVTVLCERVENIPSLQVDLITSRAVSHLSHLLKYTSLHLKRTGLCLFLKGKGVADEIKEASKHWNFVEKKYSSLTDCAGVILEIQKIRESRDKGV